MAFAILRILMAIVIPFWKPLANSFQMLPSYWPLKQWLNSILAKTGKKCNFLFILQFFSKCGKWSPKTKRNPKRPRFQMCTENKICYIYNLDIRNNKKMGVIFSKKHFFLKISVFQVFSTHFSSGAQNICLG